MEGRAYAALPPAPGAEKEPGLDAPSVDRRSPGAPAREVRVTGTAEGRRPADRASVRVSVGNSKDSVGEVTSSVSRRLEYILQTLRQHGICEKDTSVRRFLHREAELYHMAAEVIVTFSHFEKMEQVCSVLLEKLDKSVCVGTPQFYHSAGCLSQLRRQVCVSAVEDAQQKASEISQLLGQNLGPPLLIREEETKEWRNEDEEDESTRKGPAPLSHFPRTPTVTASSRVSVSFSLRDKSRKKN